MAIYHLSVKTISRSAGRSATAAAAYRAGCNITDEQTGEVHDYTRKSGVESSTLVLPENAPEWAGERQKLWNRVEAAETRKNSTVAREFEIALPAELNAEQRKALAVEFAHEIVKTHQCVADVSIHAPGKEGDNRNHHAHILFSTRRLTAEGFTEKTRELDDKKQGALNVTQWRERFAVLQNRHLEAAGHHVRVDHRSLEAQGIDREPSKHLGVAATGFERRTGEPSQKRQRDALERLDSAKKQGELEREGHQIERSIIDLSGDIEAAKAERDQQQARKTEAAKDEPELSPFRARLAEATATFRAAQNAKNQAEYKAAREAQTAQSRANTEARAAQIRSAPVEVQPRAQAFDAPALKAQWEALLKAERAQYLKELTAQAYDKCVRDVAQHQAHVDAKPLLLGKQKWEEQRVRFEDRDHINKLEWSELKEGRFPFLSNDVEAVTQAVESRAKEKNPELASAMPKVKAAIAEADKQRMYQAQEQLKNEAVASDFKKMALGRENQSSGWSDSGSKWKAAPDTLKKLIDGYNAAPPEIRVEMLARISSPEGQKKLRKLLDTQQVSYRKNDHGLSR